MFSVFMTPTPKLEVGVVWAEEGCLSWKNGCAGDWLPSESLGDVLKKVPVTLSYLCERLWSPATLMSLRIFFLQYFQIFVKSTTHFSRDLGGRSISKPTGNPTSPWPVTRVPEGYGRLEGLVSYWKFQDMRLYGVWRL